MEGEIWIWEERRRIRKDTMVEMRTSKRDEILRKKRVENNLELPTSYHSYVGKTLEHLMHAGLWCTDTTVLLEKTTRFRKLVSYSTDWCFPIKYDVVQSAVPFLCQFLMREDSPSLQFEAALALAYIAASWRSRITQLIIENRGVPMIVNLLTSPSDDVRELAVEALGNSAKDSPGCRNVVLSHGALTPLLAQLNEDAKLSMLKVATRTLSIFCKGKPEPPIDRSAVPALAHLIYSDDEEVLNNACQALSRLSKGTNDIIQAVIEAGVCPRLVELLQHPSPSVLIYALKVVRNISIGDSTHVESALPALAHLIHSDNRKVVINAWRALSHLSSCTNDKIQAVIKAGVCPRLVELLQSISHLVLISALRVVVNIVIVGDTHAQSIINHQALPCLSNLLTDRSMPSNVKEVACCIISNITAGNKGQIQAVIEANLIGPLVDLLQYAEFDVMKEAARAISNAISGGSHEQIMYLVNQGCIKPLCDLLMDGDPRIVEVCARGLENIWKVGEVDKNLGNTGVNIFAKINDAAESWFHSTGPMSLMISRGGHEVNLRLVIEDSQSPFFSANDMDNHNRDMRLNVDSMSYEELLALEDQIGYVSTGLPEEALTSSLRHTKYFLFNEENAQQESCSICQVLFNFQEDYEEEEELGTLDCGHGFHIACIEQWLTCKNICPICKSTALYTTGASFPQFVVYEI